MIEFKSALFRLILILILSGIIGWEREKYHKPAGFRTHILVGVGSALIMMVSLNVAEHYSSETSMGDPGRIAAQVVSGIGFLGAGTILREGFTVQGLTTAASLWAIAATGLAIGGKFYMIAIVTTVLIFISLFFFSMLERNMVHTKGKKLECITEYNLDLFNQIDDCLRAKELKIKNYQVEKDKTQDKIYIEYNLILKNDYMQKNISRKLINMNDILKINWHDI